MLYNASSINGAGPLTGVSLQVAGLTTAQTYTYTMKIGHTSLADLGLTWANNFNLGAPVTVAQSLSFAVPAGVPNGEWVWLPMPGGVFTYNGTDNLVIELTVETASGSVGLFTHPTANVNRIYGNPASASASTLNSYAHQIKLRFHGATVNVLPPGSYIAIAYPFSSVVNPKQQYLYRAAELGSPGTITGMACRLGTATTLATNYPNFEVVLGHTTANTLAGTFASNMVDATTVYSGTFAMPAGLRAGDWIEIPFATPFVYDGVRNLVAQMASDAGTNIHHCSARGPDATLFASRWLSTDNRTSPTGIAGGYLQDLKLRVTR
jgi:hypothetical protein